MGMKDLDIQEMANLLKALGEFNRLSLVYELCGCSEAQNAMCLCKCCSVDASVASRHLKTLAQEGIVISEKKGNLEMKDGSRCHCSLKLLDLEAWRQRLLQLVCLLLVVDHQSVEEPGAPNLELNVVGVLLDLDAAGVLPPGLQEEVLDFLNLSGHFELIFR